MLILHTASLNKYGLNRIFELTKEAGFDGIEIGVAKNNFDTQNAEYIKELMDEYKIPVLALHAPKDSTPKSIEHVVRMAEYLNCNTILITPPTLFNFSFTRWLKKEVPKLRRKKSKMQIALINAPGKTILGFLPKHALNNISDLKKFGMVCLDTSAMHSKKWDLMRIYNHLKKLVVHVHLSNVCHHKEYALPNEGILPIESFLKKLKFNKYKGDISLLVRPKELSAGEDEEVVRKLKTVKLFVEDYLK
ncbi:MAG: TIM barrel protein [Candidatus Peregrinibacteria bacterium]